MKTYVLFASLSLTLTGCTLLKQQANPADLVDSLHWHGRHFYIGMTEADAQEQLSGIVSDEAYDPNSDSTIIGRGSRVRDFIAFQLVSPEPIGPAHIVALRFEGKTVTAIEMMETIEEARRTRFGYRNRETLIWGPIELELGMTKQEVLGILEQNKADPTNQLNGGGSVAFPSGEHATKDVWRVSFAGPPMIGNAMHARLTFDGDVLSRIQILALLQ
ncbi:MAG: hypothetical protein AAGC44_14935 [Planctomycetota bacterium]